MHTPPAQKARSQAIARKPNQQEAQQELLQFLLERNRTGHMSAKDMCLIAFWYGSESLDGYDSLNFDSGVRLPLTFAKHLQSTSVVQRSTYGSEFLNPDPQEWAALGVNLIFIVAMITLLAVASIEGKTLLIILLILPFVRLVGRLGF